MFSEKRQPKNGDHADSWEAFADRFDMIAGTVSSTAAAVAKRDGELTVMRRELGARIDNLETFITATLNELRSAEVTPPTRREGTIPPGSQARDDRRVVVLTEEVASLSAQLSALTTTVQTTSSGIASHERALEGLGKRLEVAGESGRTALDGSLEQRLDELTRATAGAVKALHTQEAEIAAVKTAFASSNDALVQRLEELRQTIAGLDVQGEGLANATLSADLDDALKQRLNEVVHAMTSASERLDAQQVEIESISSTLAAPSDALELRIEELGQMVSGLVVRVEALAHLEEAVAHDADLDDAVKQRLNEVVHAMTSASERLDAQQVEIESISSTLAAPSDALELRIEELGQMVSGLVVRVEALAHLEEAVAHDADLDDAVKQRLNEVVHAMTSASERLDAQQVEIESITSTLAAPSDALELRIEELGQMVAALAVEVHGLDQRDQSVATSHLDARVSEMSGAIDEMGAAIDGVVSRVDRIAASVDDSLAALGDPEVGLAGLDRHFTEASARFETIIGDLRGLIRTLPSPAAPANEELVSQVDALRASAAAVAERIERLESQTPESAGDPAAIEHLERELAALSSRLERPAMPEEILSQLDALRLSTSTVAAHLKRLEDLASRTAENASSSATRIGTDLAALVQRIERVERRDGGMVTEIERAQALWPVALRALEARLDDLAARQVEVAPAAGEGGARVLAELRASLETMEAVAADMVRTTSAPGMDSAQENGEHTQDAVPISQARRPRRTTA